MEIQPTGDERVLLDNLIQQQAEVINRLQRVSLNGESDSTSLVGNIEALALLIQVRRNLNAPPHSGLLGAAGAIRSEDRDKFLAMTQRQREQEGGS